MNCFSEKEETTFSKLAEKEPHIGKLIRERLSENGQSISWLAKKVYCDRSNLYKKLQKKDIDTALLFRISTVLNYNFFNCYSKTFLQNQVQNELSCN